MWFGSPKSKGCFMHRRIQQRHKYSFVSTPWVKSYLGGEIMHCHSSKRSTIPSNLGFSGRRIRNSSCNTARISAVATRVRLVVAPPAVCSVNWQLRSVSLRPAGARAAVRPVTKCESGLADEPEWFVRRGLFNIGNEFQRTGGRVAAEAAVSQP